MDAALVNNIELKSVLINALAGHLQHFKKSVLLIIYTHLPLQIIKKIYANIVGNMQNEE